MLLLYNCWYTIWQPTGNHTEPKINHYITYQDFNNKNEVMYPIWNQSVSKMEPLCIQHY